MAARVSTAPLCSYCIFELEHFGVNTVQKRPGTVVLSINYEYLLVRVQYYLIHLDQILYLIGSSSASLSILQLNTASPRVLHRLLATSSLKTLVVCHEVARLG